MTLLEISKKDVIDVHSGVNLGKTDDVEFDCINSKINSLILYGRKKYLGVIGNENDLIIPWDKIVTIGEDVIMVKDVVLPLETKGKSSFFTKY